MYLHLGQDIMVRTDEIIGIFDMDNTTVAKAEKNGQVIPVTDDLPKTFVLCGRGKGEQRVYLCQISSATLRKRTRQGMLYKSPG